MAAETPVTVANRALMLIAEAPIDSLDDDSKAARLLDLQYDITREAELSLHAWSFAAIFPDEDEWQVDTGTDSAFRYLYETPSDFLRPLWMTRNGLPDGVPVTWTKWADGIRTDFAGPFRMPYIANITDPNDWPALFDEVLTAALAVKIGYTLTGKQSLADGALKAYKEAIDRATTANAFLKAGGPFVQSWLVARGDLRNFRP